MFTILERSKGVQRDLFAIIERDYQIKNSYGMVKTESFYFILLAGAFSSKREPSDLYPSNYKSFYPITCRVGCIEVADDLCANFIRVDRHLD